MDRTIHIINGKIVLENGLIEGDIEIENGRIKNIGKNTKVNKSDIIINASGKYILPGFIDVHTNGLAGFDLTSGVYDAEYNVFDLSPDKYYNGLDNALKEYAKVGVTRAILTTIAGPIEQIKNVFKLVTRYLENTPSHPWKKVMGGLYIEGTFMKQKEYRGAHNPNYFNKPSLQLFNELWKEANGLIKVVNVVPEWGEPALGLIRHLTSLGICAAAGHTGATGEEYKKAIQAGLKLAVHVLNGPTGSSAKSFFSGGAVETILREKNMYAEIIVDGYHVDKSYVRDLIKRKGYDKICAITDSMFAARMSGLDKFEMLGIKGQVSADGKYLHTAERPDTLFGSSLTMDEAFINLVNWLTTEMEGVWNEHHPPLGFDEALIKASNMCSKNPAKVLEIFNSSEKTGSLAIGKNADIIITGISSKENGYGLNIEKTLVDGVVI